MIGSLGGCPNPGNIGADFGGFGFRFWDEVYAQDRRNRTRKRLLDELNDWRNAIAHQDFTAAALSGKTTIQLAQVRRWRGACDGLAASFDAALRDRLFQIVGVYPW